METDTRAPAESTEPTTTVATEVEVVHPRLGAGRPPLEDPISHLGKFQRRVAQLKAADCTVTDISRILDCSEESVVTCLREPKVQRLMLKLGAMTVDDLRPRITEVNQLVEESLREAFENEVALMRRSFQEANGLTFDTDAAKLNHTINSSILDRGGAAAPKRLETKNTNLNLGADALGSIINVLKEMDAI